MSSTADLKGGRPRFGYDSSGRIATITTPTGAIYSYLYGPDEVRTGLDIDTDGDGEVDISRRYFNDGLIAYQVDGDTGLIDFAIVYAQDGFTPVFYVTFEDNLVADVYYYVNDHLSTPRALIDADGVDVWRARYAPFGSTGDGTTPTFSLGDIGIDTDPDADGTDIHQPLRFPGQWDDGVPGVWYNHHRFYLPDYGVYGRRDPIFRIDGNAYSYAGGNPVMAVDPLGLEDALVRLWAETDNLYPHASVETESGDQYLSFYPEGFRSKKDDWSRHSDKFGCKMFRISGLEDGALGEAIRRFKDEVDNGDRDWNVVLDQCSQGVREVLEEAGFEISVADELEASFGIPDVLYAVTTFAFGYTSPPTLEEVFESKGIMGEPCPNPFSQ